MSKPINQYEPNFVAPPGVTLAEALSERCLTQAEFAERTGLHKKTINEIIKGKAPIEPETSIRFETVLGIPARFWANLEQNYRTHLAAVEAAERLEKEVEFLKKIPVTDLVKKSWLKKCQDRVDQLRELFAFYGVASSREWEKVYAQPMVAFHKPKNAVSDPGAVSAWLRQGEIEAQRISCQPFDQRRFASTLSEARDLTRKTVEEFGPKLVEICAKSGVAVVFIPEVSGSKVCGATRWLASDRALIQLSLRYKTDDHLWFTFFHEAGHIMLHGKKEVFLEEKAYDNRLEQEANAFARDHLIPPKAAKSLKQLRSRADVYAFAKDIGIAPGIVVGRLQHDEVIPHSHLNGLKLRLGWKIDEQN